MLHYLMQEVSVRLFIFERWQWPQHLTQFFHSFGLLGHTNRDAMKFKVAATPGWAKLKKSSTVLYGNLMLQIILENLSIYHISYIAVCSPMADILQTV